MALYAIGDLHLSFGADKPMDIFGGSWIGYLDKLREGLSVIKPEDTTVLLGDLSWALDLAQAKADFDLSTRSREERSFSRVTTTIGGALPPNSINSARKAAFPTSLSSITITTSMMAMPFAAPVDGFSRKITDLNTMKKCSSGNCSVWKLP